MNVFRTCAATVKPVALKFLIRVSAASLNALLKHNESVIDEVFKRDLPIPVKHASRFAPHGFNQNVIYVSDAKETTIFEYSYHLIKNNVPSYSLECETFQYTFCANPSEIIDVASLPNRDILLNPSDYSDAQAWVHSLSGPIDTIKYPNVRNSFSAGTNFAVFKRESVQAVDLRWDSFKLQVVGANSVQWSDNHGSVKTYDPKM